MEGANRSDEGYILGASKQLDTDIILLRVYCKEEYKKEYKGLLIVKGYLKSIY